MVKKIRSIIVDDEQSARDVLENLLVRFCPNVEVLDKCNNVEQAVERIKELKPDVVFLDIEMPNYAGYEIVKFFENIDFHIVFVTAYDQYAIRAFELSAVDYLLKPVDIERLQQAIEKVALQINLHQSSDRMRHLSNTLESREVKSIMLLDKGYQYVVDLDAIIAIEAQESYSVVYTFEKKYMMSKNLKHFERLLDNNPNFIRVHKSWLINKQKLRHYSKSEMSIQLEADVVAKLSKYKKAEFEEALLH